MKILYDGEIYSIFQRGGVVRYFHNLISHLPADCQPVLLGNHAPLESPEHQNLQQFVYTNQWVPGPLKFFRKWLDRRYCRSVLKSIHPDIIHPTYFQNVARGRFDRRTVPLVLTVYDMIHERYADQMDRSGKHSRKKLAAVERADHVICISETTRQDLIRFFDVAPEKTSVTLLGVDSTFNGLEPNDARAKVPVDLASPTIASLDQRYFVFVGRRDEYKNFDHLLQAFSLLRQRSQGNLGYDLVVVGDPFSVAEQERIKQLGLGPQNVIHLGTIDDPTLVRIYQSALGFIFPTRWEGFGLPLLEAIAAGTCVLASDIPIFHEIAADAFEAFDPNDPESIADAVATIASDSEKREAYILKGRQLLKQFSWQATVAQTVDIYQRVIRNY